MTLVKNASPEKKKCFAEEGIQLCNRRSELVDYMIEIPSNTINLKHDLSSLLIIIIIIIYSWYSAYTKIALGAVQ